MIFFVKYCLGGIRHVCICQIGYFVKFEDHYLKEIHVDSREENIFALYVSVNQADNSWRVSSYNVGITMS